MQTINSSIENWSGPNVTDQSEKQDWNIHSIKHEQIFPMQTKLSFQSEDNCYSFKVLHQTKPFHATFVISLKCITLIAIKHTIYTT